MVTIMVVEPLMFTVCLLYFLTCDTNLRLISNHSNAFPTTQGSLLATGQNPGDRLRPHGWLGYPIYAASSAANSLDDPPLPSFRPGIHQFALHKVHQQLFTLWLAHHGDHLAENSSGGAGALVVLSVNLNLCTQCTPKST